MPASSTAPRRAEPALRGSDGAIYTVSSFGVDGTTFGPSFNAAAHFEAERYKALSFAESYPACTRHDLKPYDWQGRFVTPGSYRATQPFIGSALPSTYVPLDQRRPSNPYRLAKLVQKSFTALVFGEERFPSFTSDDPVTADFANALLEATAARLRMVQGRNLAGACGTVGFSWRFYEGKPRIAVHTAKYLIPHTWTDREAWELEHLTELTRSKRWEYDPKTRKDVERVYLHRRDWTPLADVVFLEVRADDEAPQWIVDEAQTYVHGDGFPHFVWARNGGDDDDGSDIDGTPDVAGLYEDLDGVDVLKSVLNKGTIRNLDPTLVLKLDPVQQEMAKKGVDKGSDHALSVGASGDAKYLELAGTAATTGLALLESERDQILEVAQCVVPSHAELTSAGTSSVAQKMLYSPMLSQASVHRTTYGAALVQLIEQMLKSARQLYPSMGDDGAPVYPLAEVPRAQTSNDGDELEDVEDAEDAEPSLVPTEFYLDLPPKVTSDPILDEHGAPTGEVSITMTERAPGKGRISLSWPDYFAATALDVQARATSISTAAGGKPVLSQQTAVELMARELKRDPIQEWARVQAEQRAAAEQLGGMWGGAGGKVEPAPADSMDPSVAAGKSNNFQSPAALARQNAEKLGDKVHTANEVRARMGDGPLMRPDGSLDPNADLPLPAFLALQTAGGTTAGNADPGTVVPDAEPPPPKGAPVASSTAAPAPVASPPAEDAPTGQGGPATS